MEVGAADLTTCAILGSSPNKSEHSNSFDPNQRNQEYRDLLRRVPLLQSTVSSSTTNLEQIVSARMLLAILQLPQEIIHQILYWLDPRDILALRATSHAFHALVHQSERDICLSLADRVQRECLFRHPRLNAAQNLLQFFEHHSTVDAVCNLADTIASKISRNLKHKTILGDQSALDVWRQQKYLQLQAEFRRTFYTIQLYLDFISKTVISEDQHFRLFSDEEFASLHNIYDLDQQDFFARDLDWLTEEDFISISCSLKIFKTFCKSKKVPFSLSSRAYPFASVRQVLFYRGLVPFARLLADDIDTVKQEMLLRELTADLTSLNKRKTDPNHGIPPLSTIYHLAYPVDALAKKQKIVHRSVGTRNEFFANQDLWDKSGRAYMMRKIGRFPNLQSVTAWLSQTLEGSEGKRGDVMIGPWDQNS